MEAQAQARASVADIDLQNYLLLITCRSVLSTKDRKRRKEDSLRMGTGRNTFAGE